MAMARDPVLENRLGNWSVAVAIMSYAAAATAWFTGVDGLRRLILLSISLAILSLLLGLAAFFRRPRSMAIVGVTISALILFWLLVLIEFG